MIIVNDHGGAKIMTENVVNTFQVKKLNFRRWKIRWSSIAAATAFQEAVTWKPAGSHYHHSKQSLLRHFPSSKKQSGRSRQMRSTAQNITINSFTLKKRRTNAKKMRNSGCSLPRVENARWRKVQIAARSFAVRESMKKWESRLLKNQTASSIGAAVWNATRKK